MKLKLTLTKLTCRRTRCSRRILPSTYSDFLPSSCTFQLLESRPDWHWWTFSFSLVPLYDPLCLSLFTTLSQIVQTTVSAVLMDAQIGVLKAPSKVGSKNRSPIFCFFANAQRRWRSIQSIFSAAPEAASAPVVAVEEASEPKGYNYPVPGTHTYFIQKLDRKIL